MLVTNHVLAGAIIGALSPSETSAFTAGVVSHFALDAVPHWGGNVTYRTYLTYAVVDGLLGATVMGAIALGAPKDKRSRVIAGMFGAVGPDLNKPSTLFFGRSPFPKWVDRLHAKVQLESPDKTGQEVLVASVLGAVAAGVLRSRVSTRRR